METKKEMTKNDSLKKDLQNLNVESLISKTSKNRSIWKQSFKANFSDNEKTARRKIRSEQMKLSKKLLHSILTNADSKELQKNAESLFSFYTDGLESFAIYSNVSVNESPEKRQIIDKAYDKMRIILNK